MNNDTDNEVLSDAEVSAYKERVLKLPCYICKRTPDEVKDYFYAEYGPDEDGPLMYIRDSRDGGVPICRGCKGLIETVALDDTDWMDEFVEEKTFSMLCDIISALETKKKQLMDKPC